MAVAYDSVSATQNFSGVSSLFWSHTNSGTTNLYLQVRLPFTSFPTRATPSAVSYDGVSMVGNVVGNAQSSVFQGSLPGDATIYELPNPATGTKTAAVTFSVTNGAYGGGACSVMYTGVKQTTPCTGTAVTNSGNTTSNDPSATVTGTTAGNMVGDCMACSTGSGSITITSGTERSNGQGGGGQAGASGDIAAGGGVAISWSIPNTSVEWLEVAAEILVAGASANTKRSFGAVIG